MAKQALVKGIQGGKRHSRREEAFKVERGIKGEIKLMSIDIHTMQFDIRFREAFSICLKPAKAVKLLFCVQIGLFLCNFQSSFY